jgi:hypothetical protein
MHALVHCENAGCHLRTQRAGVCALKQKALPDSCDSDDCDTPPQPIVHSISWVAGRSARASLLNRFLGLLLTSIMEGRDRDGPSPAKRDRQAAGVARNEALWRYVERSALVVNKAKHGSDVMDAVHALKQQPGASRPQELAVRAPEPEVKSATLQRLQRQPQQRSPSPPGHAHAGSGAGSSDSHGSMAPDATASPRRPRGYALSPAGLPDWLRDVQHRLHERQAAAAATAATPSPLHGAGVDVAYGIGSFRSLRSHEATGNVQAASVTYLHGAHLGASPSNASWTSQPHRWLGVGASPSNASWTSQPHRWLGGPPELGASA